MEVTTVNHVVTVRLSDQEYQRIAAASRMDHRPISNFMTTMTLKKIEESDYVDSIEMAEIRSNKKLMASLKAGHRDAKRMSGKFVG